MPTYNLMNKKTGKTIQKFMDISEMLEYEKANPGMTVLCGAPIIGDPGRLGRVKPSEDFRDKMRTIQKRHPLGKVNIR